MDTLTLFVFFFSTSLNTHTHNTAYKRLLAGESNLDTDVYEKLLSVNDLSTVMGASAATQAVYLYKKIDSDSAHDTDDSVKAHSDSWVIKKTSEVSVDFFFVFGNIFFEILFGWSLSFCCCCCLFVSLLLVFFSLVFCFCRMLMSCKINWIIF